MDIVIDTSALLAVVIAEPERDGIIAATSGHTLIGPGSIPWEVGNAFSAMLKHRRVTFEESRKGLSIFETIPLRYVDVDLCNALSIAHQTDLYAYDAYFLECAMRHAAPVLTLDKGLQRAAKKLGITLLEF
ncbi:MAG: type II toxin-antitoxin system VapC family toxin [Kiritimatiellia bacterium]|jgi:predicted nucleic acid-binding protein